MKGVFNMREHEYLNEERYQRTKNKISIIALLILVVGLLIGGGLIYFGYVKYTEATKEVENARTEEVVEGEIDALEDKLIPLKVSLNKEFNNNSFSEEYYRIKNEINDINEDISELKTELWKIKSGYNDSSNRISASRYVPFFMFGGFIIIASLMISGAIYISTKQREMLAYQAQQVMPVAQEGLEKMGPTLGKVAKDIKDSLK